MIFIKFEKNEDAEKKVLLVHYQPNQLPQNIKTEGIMVEILPEKPELKENEIAKLYYNSDTEELFYKVEERPAREEE